MSFLSVEFRLVPTGYRRPAAGQVATARADQRRNCRREGFGLEYPNLRHVRLFCACVRSGSLTKAAESVAVSQPAASQAITKLEAFYGSQLLERHQRRTTPTADGLILQRSEEHTSELQSLMRISYAGFCLKKKSKINQR